jgi:hypothetical protein
MKIFIILLKVTISLNKKRGLFNIAPPKIGMLFNKIDKLNSVLFKNNS